MPEAAFKPADSSSKWQRSTIRPSPGGIRGTNCKRSVKEDRVAYIMFSLRKKRMLRFCVKKIKLNFQVGIISLYYIFVSIVLMAGKINTSEHWQHYCQTSTSFMYACGSLKLNYAF
jgi:hypothetical protein